jgi:malate synthase
MNESLPDGLEITAPLAPEHAGVLSGEALAFVADLHRTFDRQRIELLERRQDRQAELDAGMTPDFPLATASVREAEWRVAPAPSDLDDRRVEITGPAERKMMINALNSGARVFMADLEDALSPTWSNVVAAQANLRDAVRRELDFTSPEGKSYALREETATLVVRPRGWHLVERHVLLDGRPVSASLFDFGLYLFHNGRQTLERDAGPARGPYFYLPKLEGRYEARLWNEVFVYGQERLGIPRGTIRATVLIETVLAAFEMDEILYQLREHAAGLNAGRWDYIFSLIKRFRSRPEMVLPDRAQVTMAVPFMRAYSQLLVRTCHRRGAHAIGGMSAFIPDRREPQITDHALAQVRQDKERESGDGFDGTWVAHPDLVPVAMGIFDGVLADRPHQKDRLRDDVSVQAAQLLDVRVPHGAVTEAGVRTNVSVALQYLAAWLGGNGAAAINHLMEDAATAEISRSQLWQWRRHAVSVDDGRPFSDELYQRVRDEELSGMAAGANGQAGEAAGILDALVTADDFPEFLTLIAYSHLD